MGENKFLLGPIDTVDEILLILKQLELQNALTLSINRINIFNALEHLKKIRNRETISGPIDTQYEVMIFLKYLRDNGILQSPVDTKEEMDAFVKMLERDGFFANSLMDARDYHNTFFHRSKPPEKDKRKRPRPRPAIEEDEKD